MICFLAALANSVGQNLQAVFHLGTDTRDQNLEAAQEAIRCIANALLLIDTGRDTLLDMGGGDTCLGMLEVGVTSSEQPWQDSDIGLAREQSSSHLPRIAYSLPADSKSVPVYQETRRRAAHCRNYSTKT